MPGDYFPTQKGMELYPSPIAPVPNTIVVGNDSRSPEAAALLHEYQGVINQFVAANRQAYNLTTGTYHKRVLTHPHLEMQYINNLGQETLILRPQPVKVIEKRPQKELLPDIMLDGYIYIYVVYPLPIPISLSPQLAQPDLEIFLNNELIATKGRDIYPKTFVGNLYGPGRNNDALITFGSDALHCHSWNDKNNEFKRSLLPLPQPGPPMTKKKEKLLPYYYPYGFLNEYKIIEVHDPLIYFNEDTDPVALVPSSFFDPPQYPKPQIVLRKDYDKISDRSEERRVG